MEPPRQRGGRPPGSRPPAPGASGSASGSSRRDSHQPNPEPDIVKRGYSASSPGLYKVEYLSNGRASCGFKGTIAGVGHVTGGPSLNDGRWHRIMCTKTSMGITLSVDGVVRASHAGNVGSINMPNDDLVIGAYRRSSPNFRGDIDEVRIEYFN